MNATVLVDGELVFVYYLLLLRTFHRTVEHVVNCIVVTK